MWRARFTGTIPRMRCLAPSLLALVTVLGLQAFGGCGHDEPVAAVEDAAPDADDAATDADLDAGPVPGCVTSPTPAPFPSGACPVPKPATADSVDEALALVGLDRCTFAFDPKQVPASGWDLKDKRRLPDYEPLLLAPLRLPAYGRETAQWLDDAVASDRPVARALAAMAVRRGTPVTACANAALTKVDAADPAPLATALSAAITLTGGAPVDDDLRAAVAAVPLDLQKALAPIVRTLAQAHLDVLAARKTDDGKLLNLLNAMPSWIIGSKAIKLDAPFLAALDAVDVGAMTTAAVQLATAVEAADLGRFKGLDLPAVEIDTPFGALVIHGKGNDTYLPTGKAASAALLLDTGGDDVYRVPVGGASLARPVSIGVDLGGKDTYAYVEKPRDDDKAGLRLPSDDAGRGFGRTLSRVARQGGAVLGVGLLWDLGGGNDTYRSLALSQGSGVLGVGVLFDDGGDDTYTAETLSQGAAGYGLGLLLDRSGTDKYTGYNELQGFGFTQGVGALVDLDGDDTYLVDPGDPDLGGDPLYDSAQLPGKGNSSMSQGCGMGRRRDTVPENIGFLGGLGLLRDKKGKDKYTGSVFAQASGFLGFGMLLDGGGDDTYEGLWYVQGSAAHLGLTLFHDAGGNDQYDPTFPIKATSIGVGHDFSVSLHLDEGGDDQYSAPGLSLGSGHANGMGLLVNVGGNDSFKAGGAFTLGGAAAGEVFASARGKMKTFGLFVKTGGTGTYDVPGTSGRVGGGTWSYAPENVPAGDAGVDGGDGGVFFDGPAKGVGVDRPKGTASLP